MLERRGERWLLAGSLLAGLLAATAYFLLAPPPPLGINDFPRGPRVNQRPLPPEWRSESFRRLERSVDRSSPDSVARRALAARRVLAVERALAYSTEEFQRRTTPAMLLQRLSQAIPIAGSRTIASDVRPGRIDANGRVAFDPDAAATRKHAVFTAVARDATLYIISTNLVFDSSASEWRSDGFFGNSPLSIRRPDRDPDTLAAFLLEALAAEATSTAAGLYLAMPGSDPDFNAGIRLRVLYPEIVGFESASLERPRRAVDPARPQAEIMLVHAQTIRRGAHAAWTFVLERPLDDRQSEPWRLSRIARGNRPLRPDELRPDPVPPGATPGVEPPEIRLVEP